MSLFLICMVTIYKYMKDPKKNFFFDGSFQLFLQLI